MVHLQRKEAYSLLRAGFFEDWAGVIMGQLSGYDNGMLSIILFLLNRSKKKKKKGKEP